MMNRAMYWDEDVLRIQNEVRRFNNGQRLQNSNGDDKMQRGNGADADTTAGEPRNSINQDNDAAAERE